MASALLLDRAAIHRRDLFRELVVRDLKVRYNKSVLGFALSLITPLFQLLVFNFLFRRVVPLGIPKYPLFALSGILVWTWFQSSLVAAAGSVTSSRELVRRPGFPAAVLPVVAVGANLVHFVLELPVLFSAVWLSGVGINAALLLLPAIILLQFALTLGLGYLAAVANVLFRDTQALLIIALQLLFFLTPLFYDASGVPSKYQRIYQLNPMAHLVSAYRAALIGSAAPDWGALAWIGLGSAALVAAGLWIFSRVGPRFAEEL